MKIVEINGGVFGSTGRIMFGIADALTQAGHEALCFSPVTTTNRDREPDHDYFRIGSFRSRQINVLAERITGRQGQFAYFATAKMLKRIAEFSPDVIHLHTLHSGFIHLPLLFEYIKKNRTKTVWTLHDCWAFTGHCPHYVSVGCEKWKTECDGCPLYRDYPKTLFDTSKKMHRLKKKWFLGVEDMTLATPSEWLKRQAEASFLSAYPVKVVHNGVDLSQFRPVTTDIAQKISCDGRHIVLGVAFGWGEKKGLDVFCSLAKRLDESYRIVLVGTDEAVESMLPDNVIPIRRTADIAELSEIYSAADVLVNPTREDTFPTVNIEALACGTPVLTFRTGGSPEIIDETCGAVVEKDDIEALVSEIERICTTSPYSADACMRRAMNFDRKKMLNRYVDLITGG